MPDEASSFRCDVQAQTPAGSVSSGPLELSLSRQ